MTLTALLIALIIFFAAYAFMSTKINAIMIKARAFTLILWSILLEALPFVLLGTILSSLIQIFVSEDTLLRILPKNRMLRLIFAALVGFVFPVCECAIIPITRALIKKGMPTGPAFAFMIATPIVNPIVILSTYNAFAAMPQMALYRTLGGFLAALTIGALIEKTGGNTMPKRISARTDHTCSHCACTASSEPAEPTEDDRNMTVQCDNLSLRESVTATRKRSKRFWHMFKTILSHTDAEIRSVGMYLIIGALIAASMQMVVDQNLLGAVGSGRISSILVMMALAFVLSLCSEADAFVASTFLLHFSGFSVLAFLLTGPMIDIKNTLMLIGSFEKRFVIRLIGIILVVCFALAVVASYTIGELYA